MINFQEVNLHNFFSYEQLTFPIIPGKHLIVGPNGSGKSSIFEGMVWCLYKMCRDRNPSTFGLGDCWVDTVFEKDTIRYNTTRYFGHSTEENNLKLFRNGEDISHRKTMSTALEIDRLLNIPYDLFATSVVILQGLPVNLNTLTGTLRKTALESMIGFSIWDEFLTKFQSKGKELLLEKNKLRFRPLAGTNTPITTRLCAGRRRKRTTRRKSRIRSGSIF